MKKIAVFTGAGISAESGVPTFRDKHKGLWYNYKVDDVATIEGWERDPQKVLEFHNIIRSEIKSAEPNEAHKLLASLEEQFEVTIITQNIDNLHERAGSTNVLHLHGELFKSRSVYNTKRFYECLGDINMGDVSEMDGGQLRPHTVLFGEYPYNVDEAYTAIVHCDYLLIVGTSLEISYTLQLLGSVNANNPTEVFYIDPKPNTILHYRIPMTYIKQPATKGVAKVVKQILKKNL